MLSTLFQYLWSDCAICELLVDSSLVAKGGLKLYATKSAGASLAYGYLKSKSISGAQDSQSF